MQKAYIGKQTNSISQLIPDSYERFENYNEETFGESYYMIEIPDGKELDSIDYYYNEYTGDFEPMEGILPEDHKSIVLEDENTKLKARIEKLEKLLNI